MGYREHEKNGVVWLTSDLIPAKHAFTTRRGGVSRGIHASLNLGVNRGDERFAVLENYRLLGEALGADLSSPVVSRQVHKAEVRPVTDADRCPLYDQPAWEADGLVTTARGLPLMIYIADCVPFLLCDPEAGVAAAVHCGWRSSVADILKNAVEKMVSMGAGPEDIRAASGPAIGPCCFETGPEVPEAVDAYLGRDAAGCYWPEPGVPGKFMVALAEANRRRLIQLGLRPEHIDISPDCTMCQPGKYWSHRATKGLRGSQSGIIII